MFGRPNGENKYVITEKNKKVLHYLIRAFKKIFEHDYTQEQATIPLKIMQNFYMEHDHLVEETLQELAVPIISYIYINSQKNVEVFKGGTRFMENIPSHFDILLNSLSDMLYQEILKHQDAQCLHVLDLVTFTFDHLMSNKEDEDQNV